MRDGGGLGSGTVEEGKVIELIGDGDGWVRGVTGREDTGSQEEKDWERKKERKGENEWG